MKLSLYLNLLLLPFGLFAANFPDGFANQLITDELQSPTCVVAAPDGRLFLTQQGGSVLVIENGQLLSDPFLTLDVDSFGERGVSGIALDPNFEQNGYLYIYYTVRNQNRNRLSRFTANGNFAVPGSEFILMDLDSLSGMNHNGGALRFGLDGKLYVAVGDGSFSPYGQDLNTVLGKILRINSDGTIPSDNPFVGQLEGKNQAIYAYGLRNPFTFDIDPASGRIFVNDVGEATYEEINEILPGRNYGWPLVDGPIDGQVAPGNYQDPFYSYSHDNGCAVVGGAFYSPETMNFPPRYEGMYFFSDLCSGNMQALNPQTGDVEEVFGTDIQLLTNMIVDNDGNLYYVLFNQGKLFKISYSGSGEPFITSQPSDVLTSIGEDTQFQVEAVGTNPLLYQWFENGIAIAGATDHTLIIENVDLGQDNNFYHATITNGEGMISSDSAQLSVTPNTRPVPNVTLPLPNSTYRAGDTLWFEGTGQDNEDGTLSDSDLYWKIDFHHDDHTHPILPLVSGISDGFVVIPRVGELSTNVWFRVYLSARDNEGLSADTYVDVFPEIVNFGVRSNYDSLALNVDGAIVYGDSIKPSVAGITHTVQAISPQFRGDSLFVFDQWSSNGSEEIFSFNAPNNDFFIEAQYNYAAPYIKGTGDGLMGAYFNNTSFEGDPLTTQVDETIDFVWNWMGPNIPDLGTNEFSIAWSGDLLAPVTGMYTFFMTHNDGVSMRINDTLYINQLDAVNYAEDSFQVHLNAGERYFIEIKYVEQLWNAEVQLFWKRPFFEKTIVSKDQLYSESTVINVSEVYDIASITVYPVPVAETLHLNLDSLSQDNLRLSITNVYGQEVMLKNISFFGRVLEVKVSDLQPGVYNGVLTTSTRSFTFRFTKT